MNAFDEFNSLALAESFQVIGETIVFQNQDIPAIVSEIRLTEELMDGGILEKRGIKIIIEKASFILPAIGEKIIYNGKDYRLLEITNDNVSHELVCETSAK